MLVTPADLRRWLKRRGLSQNQAAALIGVTQQAVSKWTRGAPVPPMAARIIELLDRIEALEANPDRAATATTHSTED